MEKQETLKFDILKVVTDAMADCTNLEDMAARLTQLLVGTLGIKGSTIFLLNPESNELEPLSSFGLSGEYLNKGPLLVRKDLDQELRAEPIVIQDVHQSDRLQYPQEAKREGIRAMISLPIRLHGKLAGVLRLYHYETWEISEYDLDALSVLAEIAGLALIYTRLVNAIDSIKGILSEVHPIWL